MWAVMVPSLRLVPDAQGGNELRHRLRTYLSLLLATVLISTAVPAVAAPTSADKMAEARHVKAQVDALNNRVEIADETSSRRASTPSCLPRLARLPLA
jgi:hypothetical protein